MRSPHDPPPPHRRAGGDAVNSDVWWVMSFLQFICVLLLGIEAGERSSVSLAVLGIAMALHAVYFDRRHFKRRWEPR